MYTYDTTLGYLLSFSHGDFNFNIIIDNNNHSINNHSINNSLPLQDEDLFKLKEWLISHSLQNVYKKLAAGYDDDIKQIATDHNLSTSQKLKFKKAI